MSVICSDKTGMLTQNRMTVKKLYTGGKVIDAKDAAGMAGAVVGLALGSLLLIQALKALRR